MDIVGTLRNARRVSFIEDPRGPCLYGQVYGDTKGRFHDGDYITTSRIQSEDGDLFKTRYSVYKVDHWEGQPVETPVAANDNVPPRHGDWMQTYSGRKFWPMDPRADEVHIEDIAHALSLQCRYAGHCIQFYSVAEHSCHVAFWLLREYGPMTAMYGLLHDASEAYLVDVPRPVKPYLAGYKEAETKVQDVVHIRFGLGVGIPKAVKEADDRIIADELVNLRPMEWHKRYDDPIGAKIGCWKPRDAEDEFLSTYVMIERRLGRVA